MDQDLNNAMTESNRVQREQYASHPVTPNQPGPISSASPISSATASSLAADPTGAGVGAGASTLGPVSRFVSTFGNSEPDPAVSGVSADPSALTPRPGPIGAAVSSGDYGMNNRSTDSRPVQDYVDKTVPASAFQVDGAGANGPNAAPGAQPYDQGQKQNNLNQLALMRAQETQNRNDGTQASANASNRIQAGMDLAKAQRSKDDAEFYNRFGVNSGTDLQQRQGRAALAGNFAVESAGLDAQKNRVAALNAQPLIPQRNVVQDEIAKQEALQKGQIAQTQNAQGQQGLQRGGQELQKGEFEVKHAGLVNDVAQRLTNAAPGSPEYKKLMMSYRTLIGKDGDRYDTKVVTGGTRFDPSNPTVPIKDPDRVVTSDRYGEEQPHYLELPGDQAARQAPQYKEGQTGTIDGKRVKIVNGVPVPI